MPSVPLKCNFAEILASKHPFSVFSRLVSDYLADIFHPLWVLSRHLCKQPHCVYSRLAHLSPPLSSKVRQLMIVLLPIARFFHQKFTWQNLPKPSFCFCSLFFLLSEWHWPSFILVSSTCPAGCQLVTLRLTYHPLQAFSCHWS